jgi:hypothetical protein
MTLIFGRKFIFYSTVIVIFTDGFLITVGGINLYLFYPLLFLNLLVLAFVGRLWMSPKLLFFLSYLALSGISGILLGTGSVIGFAKAFGGVLPNAIYYPAFMRFMKFDAQRCFAAYARCAFYVAAFGIIYLPFQTRMQGRLTSVFAEPGGFCVVCLPAAFYYADEWQRQRKHGWRCVVLVVAIAFTISSMGFMGLLFAIFLFAMRYKVGRIFAPALVVLVGLLIYNASSYFRLRLDDSVSSALIGDVSETNASTFGVMVNLFVTERAFLQHPLLGGGFGSHVVAHDRFYDDVPGAAYVSDDALNGLGRWDANSLFLRIVSELGLFGLAYAIWFLWHFWPPDGSPAERGLAMSLLCYVFIKFLRSGVYFNPEEFFFFSVYAVNGMVARTRKQLTVPAASLSALRVALP